MLSRGRVKVPSTRLKREGHFEYQLARERREEGCNPSLAEGKNTCTVPLMILYRRSLYMERLSRVFFIISFRGRRLVCVLEKAEAVEKRSGGRKVLRHFYVNAITRARFQVVARQFHLALVQHARLTNMSFNELPRKGILGYSLVDTPQRNWMKVPHVKTRISRRIALFKNISSPPNNVIINLLRESIKIIIYSYIYIFIIISHHRCVSR